MRLGSTPDCPDKYPRNAIVMTTQAVPGWSAKLPRFGSLRFDRYPPTLGKHSATHRSNLGTHIRVALPRVSLIYPCSTRAFMSQYAASMSLLSAAAFVTVPGLSFTWRMNLPVPCSKRAGSGRAAP